MWALWWLTSCADSDTLTWVGCSPVGFECATFERDGVPIAVVRHQGARKARVAALLTGGPGSSSIDLLKTLIPLLGGYDEELWRTGVTWLAMDNRGVGQTDPITCVDDAWFDNMRVREPVPADDAEADGLYASRDTFQAGCLADRGPDELAELTSEVYADDLDALREALGEPTLDLYGLSAGTWVGASYLARHPEHAGRVVLDGVVSPEVGRDRFLAGQAAGFELALTRFFDRCAADNTCAVHADPAGTFDRVLASVPLPAGDRTLTRNDLRWGTAGLLYGPDDVGLAEALAAADAGDGTLMLEATDAGWGRDPSGQYSPLYQRYWAIGCVDQPWPAEFVAEDIWALGEGLDADHPRLGASVLSGELNCLDWPAVVPAPNFSAPAAPPALLINGLYDPATPYAGAEQMIASLNNNSVLIPYDGDGHVASFIDGCSYDAFRTFLLTGETTTEACP